MPASLRSNRYPATYLGSAQSLYQRMPRGHSPYLKVVRRNLITTAPRSRYTWRFMRWRATLVCCSALHFPLIHAPGSRIERPQTRTTADVADLQAGVKSFLRQIRPWSRTTGVNSEPNGLPISNGREAVAARHHRELAEFLASSPRPSPRLRGLSPQSRSDVTTITDIQVLSVLTKDPFPPTPPPSKMRGRSPRSRA
jgi:hypothetical protein